MLVPTDYFTGNWSEVGNPSNVIAAAGDRTATQELLDSSDNNAGKWEWEKRKYTITFDANGGAGSMPNRTVDMIDMYSFVPTFYRPGYRLTGFTDNHGNDEFLVTDGWVTIPAKTYRGETQENVTLTAQWERVLTPVEGTENQYTFTLADGESIEFDGLPASTSYEVWEETPAGWVLVEKTGDSGVIEPLVTSEAVFTNEYKPEEAQIILRASKTLDGSAPAEGAFTFELVDSADNVIGEASNKAGGAVEFDAITYGAANNGQTYTYTIREKAGTDGTIAYDLRPYTAEVSVNANSAGVLVASVTYKDAKGNAISTPVFENTTRPGALKLVKAISVPSDVQADAKMLASQDFSFRVTLADAYGTAWGGSEGKVQAVRRQRGDNGVENITETYDIVNGVVDVQLNTWTEYVILTGIPKGTRYTVEEIGTYPGWTQNEAKSTGTTGVIVACGEDVTACTNTATIHNDYAHRGTASVKAIKRLVGRTLKDGEFTFELVDKDGEVVAEATNAAVASGADAYNVVFGELTYDTAGTYAYTIREQAGKDNTVKYSDEELKVIVEMKDENGEGRLTATITYENGKDTITNRVKPGKLAISKSVVSGYSAHWTKPFTFTVYLTDALGQPLSGEYALSTGGKLTVSSGSGTLQVEAGKTVTIEGLPDGANYSVVETAEGGFTQTSTGSAGKIKADETANAQFTNTYHAAGEYVFEGEKKLEGATLEAGQFIFELLDADGYVIDEATNDADGHFAFKKLEFTELDQGQRTYTIRERNTAQTGITYDTTVYEVTLDIRDKDGKGTMTVTPSGIPDAGLTFSNRYSNTVTVRATKQWKGDEDATQARRDITVILYQKVGDGERTEYGRKIIPATAQGDELTVTWDGLPLYGKDGAQIEYSVAEAMAYGEGETNPYVGSVMGSAQDGFTIINRYASTALQLQASKTLEGGELEQGQFRFVIADEDGKPVAQATNKQDGSVTFPALTYTLGDMADATRNADGTRAKRWVYTLSEASGTSTEYLYDETAYTVTVTVTEDKDGALSAAYEMDAEEAAFTNIRYATLTISKRVEGSQTTEAFPFKVELYNADGTVSEGEYAYTIGNEQGTLSSGDEIRLAHGQSATISGLLPGMNYIVTETGGASFETLVNEMACKDGIEGTLSGGDNAVEFVNRLSTTTFTVYKSWQGGGGGAISLTLYANGERMDPQPSYTRNNDVYTYTDLPMYDDQGEFIVYSAKEKYVDGFVTLYSNVEPYADKTRSVYDQGTIINRAVEAPDFSVRKVWSGLGEGETAPEITLVLYCNGVATDIKTPSPDRNGWYKYYNLPDTVNGEKAVYTVKELPVDGYLTGYKLADGTAADYADNGGQITNARIPQTGDKSPLGLYLALMGASAILLMLLPRRRRS